VAERDGASPALALLDGLATDLDGYHLFHAARADLLHRLGLEGEAAAAYDEALARATNGAERDLLARQRAMLGSG
jgi:RNA polymerase sigma-70 factor (ECF subfamily)